MLIRSFWILGVLSIWSRVAVASTEQGEETSVLGRRREQEEQSTTDQNHGWLLEGVDVSTMLQEMFGEH